VRVLGAKVGRAQTSGFVRSIGFGEAEDLARVDQVRVADLILIRAVDQGVLETGTIVRTRNVPETVATHDNQAFAVARGRRHGDALERQLEAGHGLAILGEPVEPKRVLAGPATILSLM
jgi:hypothetical protein